MNDNWAEREICIAEIQTLLENGYEVEVDSPDGFVPVNYFINKGMHEEYILEINDTNYQSIICNAQHLFETNDGWVSAEQLSKMGSVLILTRDGYKEGCITATGKQTSIVDINVEHENHRYYTNNVSSHNTGVGKSLFMCHCAAANLDGGKNVLYITLEMAEEKIAERIDANLLNTPIDELYDLPKDVYLKKIQRLRSNTVGKLIIKEYPTACASSANFRHLLNELRIKKNFQPDVIYVDYLNICASARLKQGSNINSYTYVKAIAEELRGLAVEYDVPIVSATQTTRGGYDNSDISMTDTSESFGLPATADFLIALIATDELKALNQILVKQLKNRYADPELFKRFVIGVDKSRMRLYNCEQQAQDDIVDDAPIFDNTNYGERVKDESSGSKFKKYSFSDFK